MPDQIMKQEEMNVTETRTASLRISSDTERAVEHARLRCQVIDALQRLPEPHRRALILRDIHNMTYEEVSRALGIPLNEAKAYIKRGREELRSAIHQFLAEKRRDGTK